MPTRILYDNTKIAVARILGEGERQKTRAFSELQSHYLFADKFGRPAKGNDKGKVEDWSVMHGELHGSGSALHSWDELNAHLEAECRRDASAVCADTRDHRRALRARLCRDAAPAAHLTRPAKGHRAGQLARHWCVIAQRLLGPHEYGHHQVLVKGYVHRVEIACGSEVIARHERTYERETAIYDPLHYLALLEHKSRALDQAAPLAGWQLPECFATLRRWLEARLKKHAGREYIQVLRLLETFAIEEVSAAVEDALHLGAISFDAVRHLLLCRIERRPPRLNLDNWPHLPLATVRTTQAADYMALLSAASRHEEVMP